MESAKKANGGIDKEKINKLKSKALGYLRSVKRGAEYLVKTVNEDVEAVCDRDPAAKSKAEVLLLYSGVHALAAHRVAHELYKSEHYFSARAISQLARHFT